MSNGRGLGDDAEFQSLGEASCRVRGRRLSGVRERCAGGLGSGSAWRHQRRAGLRHRQERTSVVSGERTFLEVGRSLAHLALGAVLAIGEVDTRGSRRARRLSVVCSLGAGDLLDARASDTAAVDTDDRQPVRWCPHLLPPTRDRAEPVLSPRINRAGADGGGPGSAGAGAWSAHGRADACGARPRPRPPRARAGGARRARADGSDRASRAGGRARDAPSGGARRRRPWAHRLRSARR